MSTEPSPTFGSRRSLRLKGFDYTTPGAYFVTVVTRGRVCCFGDVIDGGMVLNDAGRIVLATWEDLPSRFPALRTDAVVVMPNHLHGIVWIEAASQHRTVTLSAVVGAFKSTTTVQYLRGVKEHRWSGPQHRLWQRNYFEHIIRTEKACMPIREYIANNPAQWPEDEENPVRPSSRP